MWSQREREKFSALLTALSEIYDIQFTEALVELWKRTFERYPFEAVKKAIETYIATREEKPKPASILKLLRGHVTNWDAELIAEKALQEVFRAVRAVGIYNSVRFRDPIINAVVRELGGWSKVCNLPVEGPELAIFKNEFKRLYQFYLKEGKAPRVDYLPGLAEEQNENFQPDIYVVGEPRNRSIPLYSAEFSVYLQEGRRMRAIRPQQAEAQSLPQPEQSESAVSPEVAAKNAEKLSELTGRVLKSIPEAGGGRAN